MSATHVVVLREDTGAQAVIAPELGCWLLRYCREFAGRGAVEALHYSPEVVARYPSEMYAGNPVLFPLVSYNHLPDQDHHYRWKDRVWAMPQHGFARDCRWSVVDQGASAATFELRDSAATRTNYPFSFRQGLTYRLQRGRLHWEQVIENLSHEAMPFSTGFHPYFAAPLTPTGKRAACYIRMPEATLVTMHGRGERFTSSPLPARNWSVATDVSATMFIADLKSPELVMVDPISQLEVAFNFEDAVAHRFVAMWAKSPSEPYYCLEPWTALPNSFSRHEDGELSVLPPGGVFRAGFWMELRPSGTIAPEEQRG